MQKAINNTSKELIPPVLPLEVKLKKKKKKCCKKYKKKGKRCGSCPLTGCA